MDHAKLAKMQASVRIEERELPAARSRRSTSPLEPTTRSSRLLLRRSMFSPSRLSRRSTCSRRTETSSTLLPPRSTHPFPPTPSPSTETERTRSSPSSSPVSLTSSDPTPLLPSASSPRATRASRRRRVMRPRRTTPMMMTSPSWSRERTSRTRSKLFLKE
ncbi:Protein of unknown function [Pyronema omphalodes CBS 100304]|uniref:Uncharacterized protein n=1 Tax=Pyronema omphalodes (strain CBS 100304) TaxID=1076935 RepID=U4LEH9_PYROM|nr:Protein of unknown function [Pyronema omphalodes CBS 100304]